MAGIWGTRGVAKAMRAAAVSFLCALLLLLAAPRVAEAASATVSPEEPYRLSLTVYYEDDERFVADAHVAIYRVAYISEDGSLVPVDELATFPINWNLTDASSAQALADTLEAYLGYFGKGRVSGGVIEPADSGVTDANGVAVFPNDSSTGLEEGYYLVVAEPTVHEGVYSEPSSLMLSLPHDSGSGEENYTPRISLKLRNTLASVPRTMDVSKVWDDNDDSSESRPSSVQVTLLCDGAPFDDAILNEANGWHASWEGLDAACKWTVIENEVPDGYEVTVRRDGNFITVKNTYTKEEEPTPEKPSEGNLPQTGMLWWPVPVLLFAGAACLIAGRLKTRRESAE